MLRSVKKNLVFGALFNDDYEGTISRMGDTVKINAIGDITISSYSKDTDLAAAQTLTDAQTVLSISQAKYYNFEVDDVDQAQAHPAVMAEAMDRAGYQMALTMDQYYAGFYTDAVSVNLIGSSGSPTTPVVGSAANAGLGTTLFDYLVQLNQLLTQQAVPKTGRWCVIPPWGTTLLVQDVRWTGFNTPDARMTLLTNKLDASAGNASEAYIGRVASMDVYESLNATHIGGVSGAVGSQDVFMAGHSFAITKAVGLAKTEAYRPPLRFADAIKGLALYGAKTTRPYGLAVAYLQHP